MDRQVNYSMEVTFAEHQHPELTLDEIRCVVAAVDSEDVSLTLPILAATCHQWRNAALERLRSIRALRPNEHTMQKLLPGLKAKDPTFVVHVPALNCIAVSESSLHRIVLISLATGEQVRTFGKFGWAPGSGLNYPKGLAVDDCCEHLYVCDRSNHRVSKYRMSDGELVCTCGHRLGARGIGEELFRYPQGLAYANTRAHGPAVFVCDYGNDRLVALDGHDLSCLFTCSGKLPGVEFALPAGCAATPFEVYVVDASHHCVHCFSCADGAHLRTIGKIGCEAPEYPWGIALASDGDTCFVAMGAASGGRRGKLQTLCTRTGAILQPPIVTPGAGRLSGVCVEASGSRVFVVDHDARGVLVLTSWWRDYHRDDSAEGRGAATRSRAEAAYVDVGKEAQAIDVS